MHIQSYIPYFTVYVCLYRVIYHISLYMYAYTELYTLFQILGQKSDQVKWNKSLLFTVIRCTKMKSFVWKIGSRRSCVKVSPSLPLSHSHPHPLTPLPVITPTYTHTAEILLIASEGLKRRSENAAACRDCVVCCVGSVVRRMSRVHVIVCSN